MFFNFIFHDFLLLYKYNKIWFILIMLINFFIYSLFRFLIIELKLTISLIYKLFILIILFTYISLLHDILMMEKVFYIHYRVSLTGFSYVFRINKIFSLSILCIPSYLIFLAIRGSISFFEFLYFLGFILIIYTIGNIVLVPPLKKRKVYGVKLPMRFVIYISIIIIVFVELILMMPLSLQSTFIILSVGFIFLIVSYFLERSIDKLAVEFFYSLSWWR